MNNLLKYDYIFIGAGCATLSIVCRMQDDVFFESKKILIIEKEAKTNNDRTWCFWENKPNYFNHLIYKKWSKLSFISKNYSAILDNDDYDYKMIQSIDFYNYCFKKIKTNKNIQIIYDEFKEIKNQTIKLNNYSIDINKAIVFNSIYSDTNIKNEIYFLQHFKGWFIKTDNDCFDTDKAILMDFSISQNKGTAFVYVLPLAKNKALVEYTLFTEKILTDTEYEDGLNNYITNHLKIKNFEIEKEEFGIIPMTDYVFKNCVNNIYQIGTAGGQTKASTGYTFLFIQEQSDIIVKNLKLNNPPINKRNWTDKKFHLYDKTLLTIMKENKYEIAEIFTQLFKKNKATQVLKFLLNKTSFIEDIKIMNSTEKSIFIPAAFKALIK